MERKFQSFEEIEVSLTKNYDEFIKAINKYGDWRISFFAFRVACNNLVANEANESIIQQLDNETLNLIGDILDMSIVKSNVNVESLKSKMEKITISVTNVKIK